MTGSCQAIGTEQDNDNGFAKRLYASCFQWQGGPVTPCAPSFGDHRRPLPVRRELFAWRGWRQAGSLEPMRPRLFPAVLFTAAVLFAPSAFAREAGSPVRKLGD